MNTKIAMCVIAVAVSACATPPNRGSDLLSKLVWWDCWPGFERGCENRVEEGGIGLDSPLIMEPLGPDTTPQTDVTNVIDSHGHLSTYSTTTFSNGMQTIIEQPSLRAFDAEDGDDGDD